MRNWKHWTFVAVIAIVGIVIGFIACDNSKNDPVLCKCENKEHLEAGQSCSCGGEDCNCSEEPKIKPDTTMPLAFSNDGTLCKVTIKSDETFTANEWSTLCVQVVDAIMRGYNKYESVGGFDDDSNKDFFKTAFESTINTKIILSSSAIYDCEVKSNDYTLLYIKISAIDTVDLEDAVMVMASKHGKYPK